jgi:energy-coupling factor transport system permease protein
VAVVAAPAEPGAPAADGEDRSLPSLHAPLHPAAWWGWAVALGTAATQTNNPLLLALVLAVAGAVTAARRADVPWAGAYGAFLRLGLVVILVRTAFHVLVGGVAGTTVLFTLPELTLPEWAEGIRVGGAVTLEGLLAAGYDGLRLAVLLGCVGAANSLANPRRLLRSLPAALYELSVAVVVALSAAPQVVASAKRVRRARLLRGDTARGWRALRSVLVPVLEDALARSIDLAATMDARGYGRRAEVPAARRRLTGLLVAAALVALCIGLYALLEVGASGEAAPPALLAGLVLGVLGIRLGGARVTRTRYRPDRWRWQEVAVVLSGVAAVAAFLLAERRGTALLLPAAPVEAPTLPLVPAIGVLLGLLPAVLAPPPSEGSSR